MKPRPLIKWKSFWLGILVLGFLGWAWARSMKHNDGAFWAATHFGFGVSNGVGVFTVAFMDGDPWRFGRLKTGVESTPILTEMPTKRNEPRPVRRFAVWEYGVKSSGLKFAHWFLILLFLVPWLGFLLWRVRKQRK